MKAAFRIIRLSALLILCGLLFACEPSVRDRPFGDIRLGMAKELLAPSSFLDKAVVLLRRDERGWYAMSTMCTKDASILVRRDGPGGVVLASQYTSSTYDLEGKVLSGPAVKNLPYYELTLDQGTYGGPRDTLYVHIGVEKDAGWRLPVPSELLESR